MFVLNLFFHKFALKADYKMSIAKEFINLINTKKKKTRQLLQYHRRNL